MTVSLTTRCIADQKDDIIYNSPMSLVGNFLSAKVANDNSSINSENALMLFTALIDELDNLAVIMFSKDLDIIYSRGKFLEKMGWSSEDIKNKNLIDIVSSSNYDTLAPLYKDTIAGNRSVIKRWSADQQLFYKATFVPGKMMGVSYGLIIVADITNDIKIHEVESANANARNFEDTQSRLMADLSHEIRTPLNSIIGFTQILERENSLSPIQHSHLQTIVSNSNHLLDLIENLLDFSRFESGLLHLQEEDFSLKTMLTELRNMFLSKAIGKGLSLIMDADIDIDIIHLDKRKLKQILINVVENGIKFTERGGIKINVSNSDELIFCHISDTGIGIKAKKLPNIFDRFYRTGQSQNAKGSGIGLSIVQSYLKLMSGSIAASSELGVGTKFEISLPYTESTEIEKQKINANARRIKELTEEHKDTLLFLLDDNPNTANMLSALLKGALFDIKTFDNIEDLKNALKATAPALLIQEAHFDRDCDKDLTEGLRKLSPDLHIITLTGRTEESIAHRNGAYSSMLTKPVDLDTLLSVIGGILTLDYEYMPDDDVDHNMHEEDYSVSWHKNISELPDDVQNELALAAIRLDYEKIEIAARRVGNRRLRDTIIRLADNYRFDILQKYIRRTT